MATEQELILKLRARTEKLEKDLANAKRKIKGFGSQINKIGSGIRNHLLGVFGGAAILQGISSMAKNLSGFELQMARVKAISGATEDEFSKLSNQALELGRTTKFTAGEVGSLQLELSKLGFSTASILASADAIQKLSLVSGEGLAESAQSMAGSLRSFNLEAEESERVANVMAESFTKTALTLEKFTIGTSNSGAIANELGITIEQNTARLGALVNANIDASKAGTDLRKIYVELNAAGISYDTALELVANSSDAVAEATKLVGIRAAGALAILSRQREETEELERTLSDTTTEMGGMSETINDTLAVSFDKLLSAVDGVIKKGGVFNKFMKDAVDIATEFVQVQAEDIIDTKTRRAIEQTTEEFKRLNHSVSENKGIIEIYGKALKTAEDKLNAYKDKLLENNEELVKNSRSYENLFIPFIKLKTIVGLSTEAVDKYNRQLEIENELLKKQAEEAAKVARELAALSEIKRAAAAPKINSKKADGIEFGITDDFALPLPMLSSDQVDEAISNNQEKMNRYSEAWQDQFEDFSALTQVLAGTVSNVLIGMFDSIGTAIGGGSDATISAFDKMKGVFSDGMKAIGAAMVAMATAKIIFDDAIKVNPYAALAAGAALIVAGAALSATIDSSTAAIKNGGSGSGGGSRSGNSAGSGRFSFNNEGQTVRVEGNFKASGRDLLLVLENERQNNKRNTGG